MKEIDLVIQQPKENTAFQQPTYKSKEWHPHINKATIPTSSLNKSFRADYDYTNQYPIEYKPTLPKTIPTPLRRNLQDTPITHGLINLKPDPLEEYLCADPHQTPIEHQNIISRISTLTALEQSQRYTNET